MSCNCNNRNPHFKSCIRAYNKAAQPFTAAVTTLSIAGTPVVETGCSLDLNPGDIRINNSGLYHISADVTYTPSAAGTVVLQFYQNGVALPCAISTRTVAADTIYTDHIETDLALSTCCVNRPTITLVISGVDGTVNHTCVGALKNA